MAPVIGQRRQSPASCVMQVGIREGIMLGHPPERRQACLTCSLQDTCVPNSYDWAQHLVDDNVIL